MQTGRCYPAKFLNDASRKAFYTWSAGQMLVYNAKVGEQRYFDKFALKFYCPIPKPKEDQKYAHLINKNDPNFSWLKEVPGAILGIGAYLFYQAVQRSKAGLCNKPKTKPIKNSNRHLLITKNFFSITKEKKGWMRLIFGARNKLNGSIIFRTHNKFQNPALIWIICSSTGLKVSFSFDDPSIKFPETQQEIADRLKQHSIEKLQSHLIGIDRGVARTVQTSISENSVYHYSETQLERMRRKEIGRLRHQRRLARKEKNSSNSRKIKVKIAKSYLYARNVRKDFAHQTSHRLVEDSCVWGIVAEDLKITHLTKRCSPKYDKNGVPLPNGQNAKSGLNKKIQSRGLGLIRRFLKYKCERAGKLYMEIPAAYTSQSCPFCGNTTSENRQTQEKFCCTRCGYSSNADFIASINIRNKGIDKLINEPLKKKKIKTLLRVPRAKKEESTSRGGSPRNYVCGATSGKKENQPFTYSSNETESINREVMHKKAPTFKNVEVDHGRNTSSNLVGDTKNTA